jgi:hypothetical protein
MPVSLAHSLNKIVSISIPLLFDDKLPRRCTLVGIEAGGVWLQIADPNFRLFQVDKDRVAPANPNVFVPFPQIAYLLENVADPARPPAPPTSGAGGPGRAIETPSARKKETKKRQAPVRRARQADRSR